MALNIISGQDFFKMSKTFETHDRKIKFFESENL